MIDLALRRRLIEVALGDAPADLVLRGGRIVNVITREIVEADVYCAGTHIAGIGAHLVGDETVVVDLDGRYVAPGLIDPHLHVESSNLTVTELARAIVPRGVLGICADPHEIANVLGMAGIELIVAEVAGLPLDLFLRVPGRVPAMPAHLETSGHALSDAEIAELIARPDAVCLGGDINPALLLTADTAQLGRIAVAIAAGKSIGGQLPGFVGPILNAGVAAGLEDTHVAESVEEVVEQLRRGLRVLLTPRIDRLPAEEWPAIAAETERRGIDTRYLVLCTDDIHPNILMTEGHLDRRVRLAIESGFSPVQAVQMATINAAELMRIDREHGSVAPGRFANLVVLDDLATWSVDRVVHHGAVVAERGMLTAATPAFEWPASTRNTIRLPRPARGADMEVRHDQAGPVRVNVVEFGGPKTMRTAELRVVDGVVQPDIENDVISIAVLERHHRTGSIGRGFVGGLGIRGGAVACTVNHDSHNIFAVGDSHDDMALAANTLADVGGGYCAVVDGEVRAVLALPIAGLLSDRPLAEVGSGLTDLERVIVEELHCSITYRPVYALNFLCLPNIPDVGVTDKGIVHTNTMSLVPVLAGET